MVNAHSLLAARAPSHESLAIAGTCFAAGRKVLSRREATAYPPGRSGGRLCHMNQKLLEKPTVTSFGFTNVVCAISRFSVYPTTLRIKSLPHSSDRYYQSGSSAPSVKTSTMCRYFWKRTALSLPNINGPTAKKVLRQPKHESRKSYCPDRSDVRELAIKLPAHQILGADDLLSAENSASSSREPFTKAFGLINCF